MNIIKADTLIQKIRIYNLYRKAFPKNERKPFSVILSMQKKGKTDLWYIENNGKFLGFASTINGDKLILIDYFAISKNSRGNGFGTKLIKMIRDIYKDKGFFLEIERVVAGRDNFEETLRRKKFYLNAGLLELNVNCLLFGVEMELLGVDCTINFDEYREFYRTNYGEFAAKNILPVK